jgi:chromate reductase, NAD(P)H dehydrogenase (quinone)
MKPKITAFAASTRVGSLNQQALDIAVEGAEAAGAEVAMIYLRDYPMPLYSAAEEEANGIPLTALDLAKVIQSNRGILLASPEYNGFFSPLLKNTIDWLSRIEGKPLAGKTAAVIAASPGGFGGLRALPYVHLLLNNMGVTVLPNSPAIGTAHEVLKDPSHSSHKILKSTGEQLARAIQ